jgi:anti-anti-sigma factor
VAEDRPRVDYRVAERRGDSVTVQLSGELIGSDRAAQLRKALEDHFVDDGVRVITLDLARIAFLDNFGVAALVSLMHESQRRNKRLFITGAERQVRDKLRVTGVLPVLEGTPPRETAGS